MVAAWFQKLLRIVLFCWGVIPEFIRQLFWHLLKWKEDFIQDYCYRGITLEEREQAQVGILQRQLEVIASEQSEVEN